MAPRALKLGTRRSALARAQSAAVARALEALHPRLSVELVGIDTRGDRVRDQPLSAVQGKEFFTAEIDAALLAGTVDFTVHSYKDLSLERSAQLLLAAVPRRAVQHDVVLFAPDVRERLAGGHELVIGSSSPRRASFVPALLQELLPQPAAPADTARIRLVDVRGNVDTRLSRLREPRGTVRQLDGVVLAFAGIARLWADPAARTGVAALLAGLPRIVLPLSRCPPAPAQGALALECRREDTATAALLAALDHAPTRRAVAAERALLALRGGGCQQRFGAAQIELPRLGTLLYWREAHEQDGALMLGATQLRWTPPESLPTPTPPVRPWDGSLAEPPSVTPVDADAALAARLQSGTPLFITHQRSLPADTERLIRSPHVWAPGLATWRALARRGLWIEGCAEGLGFAFLAPLLAEPWLQLPAAAEWTVLTHREAAAYWPPGSVIATYAHRGREAAAASAPAGGPPADATHVYWASGAQFELWGGTLPAAVEHACGPGRTGEHLERAGVRPRLFPGVQQWREWLQS